MRGGGHLWLLMDENRPRYIHQSTAPSPAACRPVPKAGYLYEHGGRLAEAFDSGTKMGDVSLNLYH